MIDVDVFEIDFVSFLSELLESPTDITCINGVDQYNDYRDSFATVEMSHNWIHRPFIFNKTDSYYEKARNILRKKMPRQNQRFERVRSCFNGLAAYKLNFSHIVGGGTHKKSKCKYYSNDDILLMRSKMMRKRQQRQQLKRQQQEINEYKHKAGGGGGDDEEEEGEEGETEIEIEEERRRGDKEDEFGLFQFQRYFKQKANAFINQWDINNMMMNLNDDDEDGEDGITNEDVDDDGGGGSALDSSGEQEERENEWIHHVAKLINWSNLKGVMFDNDSGYETNLCEHISFHYCLAHVHAITLSIARDTRLYYYPLVPPPTKEDRRAARRRRRRRAARRQARKDLFKFNMH